MNNKYETIELGPIKLILLSKLKSNLTFSDFCAPIATIDFKAYDGFLRNDLFLFSFAYDDFLLETKVRDGMVFIIRNGFYQHSEQYQGNGTCQVAFQWNIDSIGCGIVPPESSSDMNSHLRAVHTPITTPPAEIVNILRKENLLNNSIYNSMNNLFSTVIDSLYCCQEDIRRYGIERSFWKEGEKEEWKPIDEPDISRTVASYLSIYGALKNFDVSCESIAGLGNMDFYISATVRSAIRKIVIEAKKANSEDLEKGLSSQLPNYMKRVGTDYGIYLVYWLKSPNYPYPKKYKVFAELEIEKLHPIQRPDTVRVICMNLSKELVPSLK